MESVLDDESKLASVDEPILTAIAKYENYVNISKIKYYMNEKNLYLS